MHRFPAARFLVTVIHYTSEALDQFGPRNEIDALSRITHNRKDATVKLARLID